MKRRLISILCIVALLSGFTVKAEGTAFTDVPRDSWARDYIAEVDALGVMGGYGSGIFGYGNAVTRAEFAVMLPRLFHWDLVNPDTPTFTDNADKSTWYYDDIETLALNGAVTADSTLFRPLAPITRQEMAVMLVRALGYGTLADSLKNPKTLFTDVSSSIPYIAMASDFGIISGTSPTTFEPGSTAKREEAATMMVRLWDRFNSKIVWSHAFYAISSYAQKNMIPELNAVSFGWSRLEVDTTGTPVLNMTASNGNTFSQPEGYQEVVQLSKSSSVSDNLSIYISASQKAAMADGTVTNTCSAVLTDSVARSKAVALIVAELTRDYSYSGVTIDFEEMKGEALKNGLNLFLQELKAGISELELSLYVCVPPVTSNGIYYDGYDYRTIGEYVDKVILMAHDYAADTLTAAEMNAGYTQTPLTPIYEIYTALDAITDSATGVQDKSKIALAISFGSIQWKLQDGKVMNASAFKPDPASLYNRMLDPLSVMNYSSKYQNPYITYHNITDDTDNIGWYEDARSVEAKMDLARMFGVTGISFWRLGLIPAYSNTADRQLYYDIPGWLAGQR